MLNLKIKTKIEEKTMHDPKLQKGLLFLVDQTDEGKPFEGLMSQIINDIK